MVGSTLVTTRYQDQDRQVSWRGVSMEDEDKFNDFIANDVTSRLYDEEGEIGFEADIRSLTSTGFDPENLNAILAAEPPEKRAWEVGEAMAEAYLRYKCEIDWPWNMERDKRNPNASLPGADLVGFRGDGDDVHLVLGEVKTSSEEKSPPGVMSGSSGMIHQIENLANNSSLISQLIKWLWFRCKDTEYETSFNAAVKLLIASKNKAIALFGVLIRDTQPNELDLESGGQALAGVLHAPTTCHLTAIYLPCTIADLPERISGGGL